MCILDGGCKIINAVCLLAYEMARALNARVRTYHVQITVNGTHEACGVWKTRDLAVQGCRKINALYILYTPTLDGI